VLRLGCARIVPTHATTIAKHERATSRRPPLKRRSINSIDQHRDEIFRIKRPLLYQLSYRV
jgi:hypothetical protein